MDTMAQRLAILEAQRDLFHRQVALQYTPYGDDIGLPSSDASELLQMYWLSSAASDHVATLLQVVKLPEKARVLDCGCGTGALARYATQHRPDVRWMLLGHSQPQLAMAPDWMSRCAGDMHTLPVQTSSCDAVLLTYVLGFGFAPAVLTEIARVLKPGGLWLWYDIAACQPHGRADGVLVSLGYQAYSKDRIYRLARQLGLRLIKDQRMDETVTMHPLLTREMDTSLRTEIVPVCQVWRKDVDGTN